MLGVVIVRHSAPIGPVIADILLIVGASEPEEYEQQVV
jgi:hypothetical protein